MAAKSYWLDTRLIRIQLQCTPPVSSYLSNILISKHLAYDFCSLMKTLQYTSTDGLAPAAYIL